MATILSNESAAAISGSNDWLNDAFGSKTKAFGTAILRVVPPSTKGRACTSSFNYDNLATAHTLTFMTAISAHICNSEAAAGQATLTLNSAPVAPDSSIWASGDFLTFQYEDGSWDAGLITSVSGATATFSYVDVSGTANLSQKVLKGALVFFHGAPADHSLRQWTMKASVVRDFVGGEFRLRSSTASTRFSPILVHSNNITAAGILTGPAYFYDGD